MKSVIRTELQKTFQTFFSLTNMEVLDLEVLNMLADFDQEVMRNEAEEDMFDRAMRRWEMEGAMEDIFGG